MAKRPIRLTEFSPRSLQAQGLRSDPARRDFCSAMLPGFRFLLAAILLSVSILVFGLGAAALFRTAHEEFAANPSGRARTESRRTAGGSAIDVRPRSGGGSRDRCATSRASDSGGARRAGNSAG